MPTRATPSVDADALDLTPTERIVALAMRVALVQRAASSADGDRGSARSAALGAGVGRLRDELTSCAGTAWCRELAADLSVTDPEMRASAVSGSVDDLPRQVRGRSRALLVLIDVCSSGAPGVRWDRRRRRSALAELTSALPDVDQDDLDRVTREIAVVRRALARRRTRWGRVAVASVVGVGIGVATMGAATPAIAAAVAGGGLTGAAATSAGLAALGGGSLAAGGFGMAGGSVLLTGIGVVSGLGFGATGSWLTGWSAGDIADEALRLAVATRLVVLAEQHDDELARRVVMALQERLDDVSAALETLSLRLRELRAANAELTAENKRLRDRLRTEFGETEQVGLAIETALDRIRSAGPDDVDAEVPAGTDGAAA